MKVRLSHLHRTQNGKPLKVLRAPSTEGHAIVKFQSCLGKTSTLRPFRGLTKVPSWSFLKTLGYF